MTVAEREKSRKAELKLGKKLAKYSGEWVAIRGRDVVGHADTLNDLLAEIDPDSVDRIMHIASEKTAVCFF